MPTITRTNSVADPISDGLHVMKIIKAETKISQQGNEYIKCRLEDLFTGERINYNIVFAAKCGPYICRFVEAIGGALPAVGVEFLLEPKHCWGRILFVVVETIDTEDYGRQPRVASILSRARAFKDFPDLAHKGIPENPLFQVPVLASALTGPATNPTAAPKAPSVTRPASWSREEVEAETQRQNEEMLRKMNQPLDMPADDMDMQAPTVTKPNN
jgi:hypothetical protein